MTHPAPPGPTEPPTGVLADGEDAPGLVRAGPEGPRGAPTDRRVRIVLPERGQAPAGSAGARGLETGVLLRPGDNVVGRGEGAGVRLDHPSVSPEHLRVVVEGERVTVQVLPGSSGTWLDGRPLPPGATWQVESGGRLRLGEVDVLVVQDPADDDDGGRQGGGPQREEVAEEEDRGATSGVPLGAGPALGALQRTSNGLWAAVALMVLGAIGVGLGVVLLASVGSAALVPLVGGVVVGLIGLLLAVRGRILEDVD